MKAVLFYFCMIGVALAQAPSGPTAEWPLTPSSVSGKTAADASGNGNDATIVNGPLTFGATGANFTGTQYVDASLMVNSAGLSVSLWFNPASLNGVPGGGSGGWPRLVANSHTDADHKGFQLLFANGGASGWFDVGNGTTEGRASWSQQLAVGTWYHYVGVYDGATVKAYINGAQVASTPFAGGAVANGTGPHINVARNPVYGGDYYVGAIWDVRVYGRGISAAEVAALYQAKQMCPAGYYMTSSSPFACEPAQGMCPAQPVLGGSCNRGDSCFTINRTSSPPTIGACFCDGAWACLSPIIGQGK